MATEMNFHLPNTPPQGHTFPPNANDKVEAVVASREVDPSEPGQTTQHRRNPSHPILTIDTSRARNETRPQPAAPPPPPAVIPPPPARTNNPGTRRPSNDLPLRAAQQSNRHSLTGDPNPVHRSIFPQYNPAAQQGSRNITPPRPVMAVTPPLPQADNQTNYPTSVVSNARSLHMHNNSLSEAFAVSNDPANAPLPSYRESMMDMPAVIQSNPHDVMDLWCLACGQDTQDLAICYNLGLDCTDLNLNSEFICLTSTGGALYSLRAMSNDLNVIRTHPMTSTNMVSVATPSLYQPSDASPLLTTVFPVLSKIQAIDQAASVSISNGLSRTEASALEREAITRAHANTAAPLLWNAQAGNYYLTLPVYSENESSAPPGHRILPIEITPNVSIRVLEPPSSASAGRQSPILTFSLPNKTLIVHANAVVALPSPYAVDILLSSMLVLLLHLHRTTAILSAEHTAPATISNQTATAPMPVPTFAPPPLVAQDDNRGRSRSAMRSASRNRGQSGSRSRAPSRLEAFLHPSRARSALGSYSTQEQSPAPRNANRLSTYSMQSATATLRASPPLPSSNTLAVRPSNEITSGDNGGTCMRFAPPPTTASLEKGIVYAGQGQHGMEMAVAGGQQELSAQGTAPELDVRNTGLDLSRFQAYNLADPRLGPGTRVMLRVLYWAFGCTVWILGVIVGVAAEGIVTVGTCGAGPKDGD